MSSNDAAMSITRRMISSLSDSRQFTFLFGLLSRASHSVVAGARNVNHCVQKSGTIGDGKGRETTGIVIVPPSSKPLILRSSDRPTGGTLNRTVGPATVKGVAHKGVWR